MTGLYNDLLACAHVDVSCERCFRLISCTCAVIFSLRSTRCRCRSSLGDNLKTILEINFSINYRNQALRPISVSFFNL